jgi:hypothetical protein
MDPAVPGAHGKNPTPRPVEKSEESGYSRNARLTSGVDTGS